MMIAEWLPRDLIRPAGLALVHSLWQVTALAAFAALAMGLARRASSRYAVAVSALGLSLAAPAATFAFFYAGGALPRGPAAAPLASALGRAFAAPAPAFVAAPEYAAPYLVSLWLAGVVVFGARAAGGAALLARMRRRPSSSAGPALEGLCEGVRRGLGVGRVVRYAVCDWLEAPAVVGWLRPVIYLPLAAVSGLSEAQLRAVIAHELAHVRRLDALVNGLQVGVEALLFYHPAAWWLSRRAREERENCCDDVAAAACGDPVDYARALLSLEESRGAPPFAVAANGGSLKARIARLLAYDLDGAGARGASTVAGAVILAAAVAVGLYASGLEFGASWRIKVHSPFSAAGPRAAGEGGEGSPEVGRFVAMRVHGVTPEFVRKLREAGYSPDADQLVSMRTHGVGPELIGELGERGYLRLDVDDLIAFRVHGVTPAFIDAVQKLGYAHPAPADLVAMRVHGVTPEYIAELRGLGVPGLGVGDLVNGRAHLGRRSAPD